MSAPKATLSDYQLSSRTYFISGFDPRGAFHYKRLFQAELKLSDWRLGRRISQELITRWPIKKIDVETVESVHELCFLHWDDIAKENWPKSPLVLLLQCLDFGWWYLLKGGLIHHAGLCPGVALCGAYPLLFLVFSLAISFGAFNLISFGLTFTLASAGVRIIFGGIVGLLVLWQSWRLANKLGVIWLTRSILFTHRLGQFRDNDLRERVKRLADQIIQLENKYPSSELKLVGHSSGSFVLAMLAAELKRRSDTSAFLPRLQLLTLGQNLANLAVYPGARLFRADLQELATEPRLPWRDITSFQDLLCFAGVNPYTSCGLALPVGDPYPVMRLIDLAKVRGFKTRWQLLGHQFEMHFDYLRKSCLEVDLPGLFVEEPPMDKHG